MSIMKTSQGEVFYEVRGQGTALVLNHADTSSGLEFQALTDKLAERFRLVIVDYPGCGRSPRRALSNEYYKENAKAVIDVLKKEVEGPVWALGNGGGAIVSLWMAILAPARVAGVVADSFAEFLDEKDLQRDLASHADPTDDMVSFFQEMNGDDWRMVLEEVDRVQAQMSEQQRSAFHWRLDEIQCPVLLTGSRTDPLVSGMGPRLLAVAEQVAAAQLVLYDSGGHPAMFSQAKQFWRDALNFIDDHSRTS